MPPPLDDARACMYCDEQQHCAVAHVAIERGPPLADGVAQLFSKHTAHLEAGHVGYYEYWNGLVAYEEAAGATSQRELYGLRGGEREARGRALANMHLVQLRRADSTAAGPAAARTPPRWVHTFGRALSSVIRVILGETGSRVIYPRLEL